MSTDTDYVITIKGKDAALRKAAADFIELSLHPWNPQREDKKTLTRLDVFRNESAFLMGSDGFFTPSALCEEAAALFPGVDVSFSSEDEHGYTEEGEWADEGAAPKDVDTTVAASVLKKIDADVHLLKSKMQWLVPLAHYCSRKNVAKDISEKIKELIGQAEAESKARADSKADARAQLEKCVAWTFSPVLLTKTQKIADLGAPSFYLAGTDDGDESHVVYEAFTGKELKSKGASWLAEDPWNRAIVVGFPLKLASPDVAEVLRWEARKTIEASITPEGRPRLFVRHAKGVRATNALLDTSGKDYFWTFAQLSREAKESDAEAAYRSAESIGPDESMWRVTEGYPFAELWTDSLVANASNGFVATESSHRKNRGQIVSVSLADGSVAWTSKPEIEKCEALALSGEDNLLALISTETAAELLCLDTCAGKERWRIPLKHSRCFELAATHQTAVVLSFDAEESRVLLVDVSTGKEVKECDPASTRGAKRLCMDSNRIYLLKPWEESNGKVMAMDFDGRTLWSIELPSAGNAVSLAGNGCLLVSLGEGGAISLECSSGKTIWHATEDETSSEIIVGDGGAGFFPGSRKCVARNISDGSVIWEMRVGDETAVRGLAVTKEALVLKTEDGLLLADVATGILRRALSVSSASRIVITSDGKLCCIGSSSSFPGNEFKGMVFCLDLGEGESAGPWAMERQGASGASFLPTETKAGYRDFIKAWKSGAELVPRFAKLGGAFDSDASRASIQAIIRGHELIAQAREWFHPAVGKGKSAAARGAQWRLVMAYGGFELLAKSLTATKRGGLDEKTLSDLIGKLSLPDFDTLVPPSIGKSSLKEWMEEEDASDVLDFLKMENGDRKRFDAWLAKQKPVETWTDAVLLAKALRSATVHGALSPTKIDEWKIGDAVSRLTDEIFRLDEAVFEILGRA